MKYEGKIQMSLFEQIVKENKKHKLDFIEVKSTGGYILDEIQIHKYMNDNDIGIIVLDECHSACASLFINTNKRYANDTAKFGIHNVTYVTQNPTEDVTKKKYTLGALNDMNQQVVKDSIKMYDTLVRYGLDRDKVLDALSSFDSEMVYFNSTEFLNVGLAKNVKELYEH